MKMKMAILIALTVSLIGCNFQSNQNSKGLNNNAEKSLVKIDTTKVKGVEFRNICFEIGESTYPNISGLEDNYFENQLNEMLKSNFTTFIDSSKIQYSHTISATEEKEHPMASIPASVNSSFEILTKTDSIISILQTFYIEYGGGGNGYGLSAIITNVDCKNRIILSQNELISQLGDMKSINKIITQYFDRCFPESKNDFGIDYPLLHNENELQKVSLGIRNDSILMVIEAIPAGHVSQGLYKIPISHWRMKKQ